jgi:tRNA (guanine37-N1)-methyltransferase
MKYTVLTLFPEIFDAYFASSIMAKAIQRGIIQYQAVNIRDFALDRHKTCDDAPYGGGPGMLMLPQPLGSALKSVQEAKGVSHPKPNSPRLRVSARGIFQLFSRKDAKTQREANSPETASSSPRLRASARGKKKDASHRPRIIYLSPSGRPFDQGLARELAGERELALVCGRYEGIDQRIIDLYIDDEISVGDYVLSSGEVAALALIDATYRLVDEVITAESLEEESFSDGLLEYPQYTRPENYDTIKVPEVLLSGHHENIRRWRLEKRVEKTLRNRPDLIRRGRELGLFNEEINSIINRQLLAEGDTEDERD